MDAHLPLEKIDAGQTLAKRGDTVDAKLLAALEKMRTLNVTPTVVAPPVPPPVVVTQIVEQVAAKVEMPPVPPAPAQSFNLWWLAGVLVLGAWWLARRKPRGSLLPARVAGTGERAAVIECPSCHEEIVIPAETVRALIKTGEEDWEKRALAAEHRAHRAHEAIRTGVLKQFSNWLKQRFVRSLISERTQLLDSQQAAAAEVAELERRLDDLHAPLQERLRAYERRVMELEKSLAAKDTQNRELIQAKIRLTRQHLEAERARNEMELN
ncbi:MAG: hypothetical protein EXS35_00840 [Pedosphaera sp.]|nr:hypothetical protein [Pedosphaera sp.]